MSKLIQLSDGAENLYPETAEQSSTVNFTVGTFTGSIAIRKKSGIVEMNGTLSVNTAMASVASGTQIATIPSGFRPKAQVGFLVDGRNAAAYGSSDGYQLRIEIRASDGAVILYGKTAELQATRSLRIMCMYVGAESA